MKRCVSAVATAVVVLVVGAAAAAADTVTVEPGDTLSGIAAEQGTTWQDLYEANRDRVDDPDLIYPGQVLRVETGGEAVASDAGSIPASSPGRTYPATGSVTSDYGMRTHPLTGVYKMHTGTDFGYGDGVARAAASGTVESVVWSDAYGNLVTISHGDVETRYAHLAAVSVHAGQGVDAGDKVGDIGSTGMSTGPHLHFEVWVNGERTDPLDRKSVV